MEVCLSRSRCWPCMHRPVLMSCSSHTTLLGGELLGIHTSLTDMKKPVLLPSSFPKSRFSTRRVVAPWSVNNNFISVLCQNRTPLINRSSALVSSASCFQIGSCFKAALADCRSPFHTCLCKRFVHHSLFETDSRSMSSGAPTNPSVGDLLVGVLCFRSRPGCSPH